MANEYGQNGQDVAQYYRSQTDIVARKQFGLKGQINPGQETTLPMAGGLKYYHPDLRGSVAALTDPHGEVVEQYRYDAFGGLFTGITAPYNTSGLNGHEFDPASGLVDMKARWYAPQNGRFLTADTWRGNQSEPWTQNRYAYTGNNPVTRWDPTGNFSCTLGSDCIGDSTWAFFQGSWTVGDGAWLVRSWTDLEGSYRKYSETETTYYDYHVYYIVWLDRSKGMAESVTEDDVTYSRTTSSSWTNFDPHTQDSLDDYTEEYKEARTGPMPEEVTIQRETTVVVEQLKGTGPWADLRPSYGDSASAGSQVMAGALAEVMQPKQNRTEYQVQSGDTLWAIAERLYGDGHQWQEIAALNPELSDPGAIYSGQILALPGTPRLQVAAPQAPRPAVAVPSPGQEWDFTSPTENAMVRTATYNGMGDVKVSEGSLSGAVASPQPGSSSTGMASFKMSEYAGGGSAPSPSSPTPFAVNPVVPEQGKVYLTSNYGTNQWNYTAFPRHYGIDLSTESETVGADIVSATKGTVIYADIDPRTDPKRQNPYNRDGFGYVAVVQSEETLIFYAHLAAKPTVQANQAVEAGTPIGVMGKTGYSDGPHLHLEMWQGLEATKFGPESTAADWWTLRPGTDPEKTPGSISPCSTVGGAVGCTTDNGLPSPQ